MKHEKTLKTLDELSYKMAGLEHAKPEPVPPSQTPASEKQRAQETPMRLRAPERSGHVRYLLICALVAPIFAGCSSVNSTDSRSFAAAASAQSAVVYVADFDLEAGESHKEWRSVRIDSLDPFRRTILVRTDIPNETAARVVNLMSDSIVTNLAKAGYPATRLASGQPMPSGGWLVRGVFTEIQEGNRLQRAAIGFGAEKTDLQVVTSLDRLADGPPKPLYEAQTDAASSTAPGSAALIVLNPHAGVAPVAVHFVVAPKDLDNNVKETAGRIAVQVEEQIASRSPRAARSGCSTNKRSYETRKHTQSPGRTFL
jgi:hypothetical protein